MQFFNNIATYLKYIVDIAIISVTIYGVLKFLVTSNKYRQVVKGVFIFIGIYVFASIFDLKATQYLYSSITSIGLIVLILLFQEEIKLTLESIGSFSKKSSKYSSEINFIEELTDVVFQLTETKTGALIAITKSNNFSSYTDKSILIDAEFSKFLIKSIFNKESPLHDGAVVIQENKVKYASVYFPISLDIELDKQYGTRHRAALTISKETDALVIVVSEENGSVSFCYKNKLYSNVDKEFLLEIITEKLEER